MDALGPWHVLLILLGFVLLFGYRALPKASRSLGRSLRIFRSELRGLADDDGPDPATLPAQAPSPAELEREAVAAEKLAADLRAAAETGTKRQ